LTFVTQPSTQIPSPDAPRRPSGASAARSIGVAVASIVFVFVAYVIFVRTHEGQRLDLIASDHVGQSGASSAKLTSLLHDVTIGSIALTLGVCVVIAVLRQRWRLAAGALAIVGGATLTTEGLKHLILTRPEHGYGTFNTFPSGHTTVTASLVLAALLVVPNGGRWLVQLVGSLGVGVVGTGTVVAGWHHPSDVVAGLGVTLAWGAIVLAMISMTGVDPAPRPPRSHPVALFVGLMVAAALFVALGVRPDNSVTDLVVLAITMTGLALAGAVAIGVFARLVDARVA
jgi:membrane-associated phospholipid phosphatase